MAPVQQESYYRNIVTGSGSANLLRQAYVRRQSYCNFTLPELVAGLRAVQQRVQTGQWGSLASPMALETAANALNIGPAAFISYTPRRLSGNNGVFKPKVDGTTGGAAYPIDYASASNWLNSPLR